MARFLKAVAYISAWLGFTLVCGAFGAWWPIRNVDEPWAGDGIGMMMYGTFGLMFGAIVGAIALMLFLSRPPRIMVSRIERAAEPGEGTVLPPNDTPPA